MNSGERRRKAKMGGEKWGKGVEVERRWMYEQMLFNVTSRAWLR